MRGGEMGWRACRDGGRKSSWLGKEIGEVV